MDYQIFHSIDEVQFKEQSEVKQDIYELWQECFEDTNSYTNFYFDWKVKENQILLIYKDTKLVAMLHLNPYIVMAGGEEIPANYIVGVATKKEERRKGLMRQLIETALFTMYEKEMPFTYLMPAKESIYLPFDFRTVYEQEPWNELLRGERLNIIDGNNRLRVASLNDDLEVVALGETDSEKIEELVEFTNQLLEKEQKVFVKRTMDYYIRLIHEMRSAGGEVLLCYKGIKLIGYLSYMAEDAIYITECIAIENKKHIMLQGVSAFLSKISNLDIHVRQPESQVPSIMARIVNLETFAKRLTSNSDVRIILNVEDPIIDENQGSFVLECNKEGGLLTTTSESPEVSMSIADLTCLLFGKMDEKLLDTFIIDKSESIREKLLSITPYNNIFINDVV